ECDGEDARPHPLGPGAHGPSARGGGLTQIKAARQGACEFPRMTEATPPGRLILIDDDADVLNALRFTFEADGYEVLALASGEALLDDPPRAKRTCIVIDQRLPGL